MRGFLRSLTDRLTLEIVTSGDDAANRLLRLFAAAGVSCQRLPFGLVVGDGIEQVTVPAPPTYFP